jgi:trimeric autotransporter adhesin
MHSTQENHATTTPHLRQLQRNSGRLFGRQSLPMVLALGSVLAGGAMAQPSLTLSSAAGAAGGTTALNLALSSPSSTSLAGLQWTMSYPAGSVSAIKVTAGSSAAAAGKTVSCAGGATAYTCVVSGADGNAISNGAVASVAVTLSSSANSAPITLADGLASSPTGDLISVSTTGGGVQASAATAVTVTGVSCSSASLSSSGSATCSVTLSGAAGAGGAIVALASSSAALTVPASITVPQNAATASFVAKTAAIAANSNATLTASLNGASASTSIALIAPTTALKVTAVRCDTSSLLPLRYTNCLVFLSSVAGAGGATVTLASSSAALTAPASVTIAQGAGSTSFTIKTGAFTANSTANLTASLNGSSASTSISLIASTVVTAVHCNMNSLLPSSYTNCLVFLSSVAGAGGATVTLASSSAALTAPASVTIAQGAGSTSFTIKTGAFTANSTATLTASLNGSSASASISLITTAPTRVWSLSCPVTSISSWARATCVVSLSAAAPAGGAPVAITVTPTGAGVTAPASVTVSAGSKSAFVGIAAGAISSSQSVTVTASLNGSSVKTTLSALSSTASATPLAKRGASEAAVAPAAFQNSAFFCDAKSLPGGHRTSCELRLDSPGAAADSVVFLSSTSEKLKSPAALMLRAGQRRAGFEIAAAADAAGELAALSASLGGSVVQTDLTLSPMAAPPLSAPEAISGSPAAAVRFQVAADQALTLAAAGLPKGASFDPETGIVEWLPSADSLGSYDVTFTATGPGGSSSAATRITIGTAAPAPIRRALSPRPAAPVILTVARDNGMQAVAFREGAADPAALPNPDFRGQPAVAGDLLSVWVSGIRCDPNGSEAMPTLRFGDQYALAKSLTPHSDAAGVCLVTVEVPAGIAPGQTPVRLEVSGPQGTLSSNTASVAVEN